MRLPPRCDVKPDFSRTCWYRPPGRRAGDAGYTLFRKNFTADGRTRIEFAVSADNRYNLYLDGRFLGSGPNRSDLLHYSYDGYSIVPEAGGHVLAIETVVWNGGWRLSAAPWSEMHAGGGLMVSGGGFDLPAGWKSAADPGRRSLEWEESWNASTPVPVPAPPLDRVDFHLHDFRWKLPEFDDSGWAEPVPIGRACPAEPLTDPDTPWLLGPRKIGFMKQEPSLPFRAPECLNAGKQRTPVDLGRNQTSMIRIRGRGGNGSLRLIYSERREDNGTGKEIRGYSDLLILPAGKEWEYNSFWYRSGRWIELVSELAEPCRIDIFQAEFISYDFGPWKKYRNPEDPGLEKIYDVSIHTARCCAHETYEDCPYWEQMQYVGDSRIQALISYEATGNGVLGRHCLELFDLSRLPCGLTQSRYPSTFPQVIPEFSLIWVLAVDDYLNYFPDDSFAGERTDGICAVLGYFEKLRRPDGLIGFPGFWDFTDWAEEWKYGRSERCTQQPETILNLFYVLACRAAGKITGRAVFGDRAERTLHAVRALCLDPERGLLRDVPESDWFSVHANALGILAGCFGDPFSVSEKILSDRSLTQCSLYFRFYVLEAMRACGNRRGFRRTLEAWETILKHGDATTFPEIPSENTRSRCHGWSASPAYELLKSFS